MDHSCGIIVPLLLILIVFQNVSQAVPVSLTSDVSPVNGKFCPEEIVTLTCRTFGVASTSLQWFYDGSDVSIPALTYLFSTGQEFPLSRNISLDGFRNYTIVDATRDQIIVNFTATLEVELRVLFSSGHRNLQCGSGDDMANFSFHLDIEDPPQFQVNHVQLFYNATVSLDRFVIQTERPVYSSPLCQYKNDSLLNTSIVIAGETLHISDSYCQGNTCTIELSDDVVRRVSGDLVNVSVFAENIFNQTTATPAGIVFSSSFEDNFNFTLRSDNCNVSALCTANQTLGLMSCNVSYGTDPAYRNFSHYLQEDVNQEFNLFNLRTLDAPTTYYIQSVFTINSSGVAVLYHLRRPWTENNCSMVTTSQGPSSNPTVPETVVVVVVVLGIMLVVVLVVLAVITLVLCCRNKTKYTLYNTQSRKSPNSQDATLKSQSDMSIDLEPGFKKVGEHTDEAIMERGVEKATEQEVYTEKKLKDTEFKDVDEDTEKAIEQGVRTARELHAYEVLS